MANLQEDPQLAKEADKSGMIHGRKHPGESVFLPGYGTTNFGLSYFEEDHSKRNSVLLGSGVAATGLLLWGFREKISSGFGTLANYALLLKEALSEKNR